jgi:hypothetical protein
MSSKEVIMPLMNVACEQILLLHHTLVDTNRQVFSIWRH